MKFYLIALILLCTLSTRAMQLSDRAVISILTCAPGNELYSLFGHTAIRVQDTTQQIDIVFNYGTFDFRTDNFYLKYAQGLLPYQLSISSHESFLRNYQFDGRSVYSQTLNLDSTGRAKLMELLVENYRPENRTYLYNFLFDNCSTRVRDIIENSATGTIKWTTVSHDKSFWNLLDEYLCAMPWVKWGIHTILGQPGSQKATPYQYLFLPDYLMYGIDSSTYQNKRLAGEIVTLYQAPTQTIANPWYRSPYFVLPVAVLLIILLLHYVRSAKLLNTLSCLLFLTSGLLGLLLVFLGFFTEHPITFPNWNIIWANPLNVIAALLLFRRTLPAILRYYLNIYAVILAVGIPAWFFFVPAVPLESISLLILMLYLALTLKSRKKV